MRGDFEHCNNISRDICKIKDLFNFVMSKLEIAL
jgi:hypothetical protein